MSTHHGDPATSADTPTASDRGSKATSGPDSSPMARPEQRRGLPQPPPLHTASYADASTPQRPPETLVDQSDQRQPFVWDLGFGFTSNDDALRSFNHLQPTQAGSSAPQAQDWGMSLGYDFHFSDLLSSAHAMVTSPLQGSEHSVSGKDDDVSHHSNLPARPRSNLVHEPRVRHDATDSYSYHRTPSSTEYSSQLQLNGSHLPSTQPIPHFLSPSTSANLHTGSRPNDDISSGHSHRHSSQLPTSPRRSQQDQSIQNTHGIEQRSRQRARSETGMSPQLKLIMSKNGKFKKQRKRPFKRERSRFSSPKRRQVAERRQQGACDTCRKRKVTVESPTLVKLCKMLMHVRQCHRPSPDAPDCPAGSGRRRIDSAPPVPNFTSVSLPPVQRHRALSDTAGGSHPTYLAHRNQPTFAQFQNNHMHSDLTQSIQEATEPMLEGFGYGIHGNQRPDRCTSTARGARI